MGRREIAETVLDITFDLCHSYILERASNKKGFDNHNWVGICWAAAAG